MVKKNIKSEWAKDLLNQDDLQKIEHAIQELEKISDVEVVPMLVQSSGFYGHVRPMLLLIFVILALIFDFILPQFESLGTILFFQTGLFLTLIVSSEFISRFPFVRRLLTSPKDRDHQVWLRAKTEFYEGHFDQTSKHRSVLIFVSWLERRSVILVDQGIQEKMPQHLWTHMVGDLVKEAAKGDLAAGYVKTIHRCADVLREKFPWTSDMKKKNEIANSLIIKD
jgi:uncharacterized membrane protein